MALFKNGNEEQQALIVGAAVALHALIAGRAGMAIGSAAGGTREQLVNEAFAIAEEFWRQAKSRITP